MTTYYVATYRPPYPEKGVKVTVYKEKDYSVDVLPPGMTSVWRVQHVKNRESAIACVIERAAGKGTAVAQVF